MIQLTEKELFELMTNLYNRKDNFNTLADAHEYINNEISKVKNLDLATVGNQLNGINKEFDDFLENYCLKQENSNEWCYQGLLYPLEDLIQEYFTRKKVGDI